MTLVDGTPVPAPPRAPSPGLREAQRALARSQARLEAAFAHAPVGQFELDADAVLRRANPALAALLEARDPAELIGLSALELLADPAARREHRRQVVQLLQADGGTHQATQRVRTRTGRVLHVAVSTSVLRDEDGGFVAVLGSVLDVTGREQEAEALATRLDRSTSHGAFVQAVLDTVSVGIVACDADGRLTVFNDATRAFHGQPADPTLDEGEWPVRFALYDATGERLLEPHEVPVLRALREGSVRGVEMVIAPEGLPSRLVRCDGQALRDPDGRVTGAVVAMHDVTAARRAQREVEEAHDAVRRGAADLARSEAQFRQAFEAGPTPMCRLDGRGVVSQVNPALRRLLARPTSRVLGRRLAELVAGADRETLEVALSAATESQFAADLVEVRMQRQDGTTVWCEVAVSAGQTPGDGERFVLVQLVDVEDRKNRETALEQAASTDSLTGLPNRSSLTGLLAGLLRDGEHLTLLFADLDGFKRVNDEHGHETGDEVLVEVAARLRGLLRPEDVVARLGGDEFVLVTTGAPPPGQHPLVDRAKGAVQVPVRTRRGPVRVGLSVGAVQSRPGEDAAALLRRADARMYADKRGKGLSRSDECPSGRPRLSELVSTAVLEDRLVVHYQPVVDLLTGATVGAEALLRMLDREGRLVSPDAFIPLAEASGDIHELGRWVLQQATRQAAAWKAGLAAAGDGRDFAMGVNLSPRQLEEAGLLEHVDDALRASGLDASALVLELTERLLTPDTSESLRLMQRLRERGVHLACDDFGAGHSSVRYLLEFPLDVVKVDRGWTSLAPQDSAQGRLARGLLRLATSSGLVVVVEGIERPEERDAAVAAGCSLGQGYLLGRPLPASGMTQLLAS